MQHLLRKNRKLLQDIDVDDILDDIISSNTLTVEDTELIKTKVIISILTRTILIIIEPTTYIYFYECSLFNL